MRTPVLNWNGMAAPGATVTPRGLVLIGGHETTDGTTPHSTPSLMKASGVSPLPRLIAPARVPSLAEIRVLAISRFWAQPCTNTPPPPCELLMMDTPSMRDGLQKKLPVPYSRPSTSAGLIAQSLPPVPG